MIGLVRNTVSPSSSSMSRSTPWVEGCCGPMLMIIVWSSRRSMSMSPGSTKPPSGRRSTAPTSLRSSSAFVTPRGASSCAPSDVSATKIRSSASRCAASVVSRPGSSGVCVSPAGVAPSGSLPCSFSCSVIAARALP